MCEDRVRQLQHQKALIWIRSCFAFPPSPLPWTCRTSAQSPMAANTTARKHSHIPQLSSQSQLLLPRAGTRRTNHRSRGKLSMPAGICLGGSGDVCQESSCTPAAEPKTCADTKAKIPAGISEGLPKEFPWRRSSPPQCQLEMHSEPTAQN